MKYIECVHCQKRYPSNRKFEEAMGKKVRCTECGGSFPIIVYAAKLGVDDSDNEWKSFELS
ncbi:MAG: hypothetical protein R8K54_00275 [Mariprofundaceae bacterium]